MDIDSIKEYARLENYYWWFVGRRKVISSVLGKYFSNKSGLKILDWGCGPGGNFSMLEKYGRVLGVDASDEALKACRDKGITNVVKAGTLQEFSTAEKFDLVANFDVLEHIPEDEQFLKDLKASLKPGGHVLVTVPAYQFLWSELDKKLGHVRRYTRGELKAKFEQAGYQMVKSSYFIFFLAVPFIGFRFLQELMGSGKSLKQAAPELPRGLNWLLKQLVFLEARLIKYLNLPFGTSVIFLAKKREE